jgi:hypothetical protein
MHMIHAWFNFLRFVNKPDTGYGIPAPSSLRGAGYQLSAHQSDTEYRREVMEQASKRTSSHEGGLLLDPLHKKTRFSSVPRKDREERHHRVPTHVDLSTSGFPLPVSRCQAAPEPEMTTGFSSQATTSNQSTDLLLQQLMAEMKYLRERVDTLPTGPIQGVATSLHSSREFSELSSQSFSHEDMEVVEQTALSYPQTAVPAQLVETSTANPQVSEMAYFRALIRKHVNTEVCPLPPESPSLSHPKFMIFGALAPPRPEDPRLSSKALAALPPSPSIIDCCKLLSNTVSDSTTGSVGHQRTLAALVPGQTLANCLHPACQLLISISLITTSLILCPAVGTFLPLVLRDERQISSIAPKALASSSYKELKNEEALAKDTTNVLSYCELALYMAYLRALSRAIRNFLKRPHNCVPLFM